MLVSLVALFPTSVLLQRGLRFVPVLRSSGFPVTMPGGGTRLGEEVRVGPHGDNRCGGNRCGVAPTAAPLRPQVGPGLSGSGLYRALRPSRVVPLHQG